MAGAGLGIRKESFLRKHTRRMGQLVKDKDKLVKDTFEIHRP